MPTPLFQLGNDFNKSVADLNVRLNGITDPDNIRKIEIAAVAAGTAAYANSIRKASKGTVKREIGKRLKLDAYDVEGRVGLMRFPKRGVRYRRSTRSPHGVYLERGTKYIRPQRFIAGAIAASRARAVAAMERAAQRKIEFLLSK